MGREKGEVCVRLISAALVNEIEPVKENQNVMSRIINVLEHYHSLRKVTFIFVIDSIIIQ